MKDELIIQLFGVIFTFLTPSTPPQNTCCFWEKEWLESNFELKKKKKKPLLMFMAVDYEQK